MWPAEGSDNFTNAVSDSSTLSSVYFVDVDKQRPREVSSHRDAIPFEALLAFSGRRAISSDARSGLENCILGKMVSAR